MNPDGTLLEETGPLSPAPTSELVLNRLLNHFNIYGVTEPKLIAEWYNRLQRLAESTRLGIPVTISTDPRHAVSTSPFTTWTGGDFSKWPEPLGLAATGDPTLVEEFGDVARQEYLAVGIRTALHPMADLATEPRWPRIQGTFGEDAVLASQMIAAYIRGFQGEQLGPNSVACMTKHFPGGGPQMDGEDAHFSYGREQVYPGDNFEYHLIPFEAAFKAGTAQIMPYYGMPVGLPLEEVGFGFNRDVITGILRERYAFDGVVCTDWRLLNSVIQDGEVIVEAKCWGVENLSVEKRAAKALNAGVDQFGGEDCPGVVVNLVREGVIAESRIDDSVRRLLREKFRLGLFDNPYVDVSAVNAIVGKDAFCQAGALAQRKSIVLLKNGRSPAQPILPIQGKPKLYVENVDPEVAEGYGHVVGTIEEADIALLRIHAPYEQRDGFLEGLFHAGDLDFKDDEKARLLSILNRIPTIVDIFLERPAVIPEIAQACAALLANFGAADDAVLDIVFGRFAPTAKLPVEIPSSMEAVRRQKEDLPYDSAQPLYHFGHGLTYADSIP